MIFLSVYSERKSFVITLSLWIVYNNYVNIFQEGTAQEKNKTEKSACKCKHTISLALKKQPPSGKVQSKFNKFCTLSFLTMKSQRLSNFFAFCLEEGKRQIFFLFPCFSPTKSHPSCAAKNWKFLPGNYLHEIWWNRFTLKKKIIKKSRA